jgi:hypothetical protein
MFYDYFRLQGTDPIDIHLPYVFQHHQSLLLLLGWDNIESHLKQGIQKNGQKGSFCLITVPELENLPTQAKEILTKRGQRIRQAILSNLKATKTKKYIVILTDIIITFYYGINLRTHSDNLKKLENEIASFLLFIKT